MQNELGSTIDQCSPETYQIKVKGQLGCEWAEWFEGFTITLMENGDTVLTGIVVDQAAMYGLLKKLRDFGLSLVSVNPIRPIPASDLDTDTESGLHEKKEGEMK